MTGEGITREVAWRGLCDEHVEKISLDEAARMDMGWQ